MGDPEKTGGLVPELKDLRAVKAYAEAIGMPVEEFADRLDNLIVVFRKRIEDDGHLPLKDFVQAVHQIADTSKAQDVTHKRPEDAVLCGAVIGWAVAGYVGMTYKQQSEEG